MSRTIYTVGHGRRSSEELLEVLQRADVRQLVDVRAYPRSARHPWFNSGTLQPAVERTGIAYRWLGRELGGRREPKPASPHLALPAGGLRAFADYMATPEFARGVGILLEVAAQAPTAFMCAETSPMQCHRSLIADHLIARGIPVTHLLDVKETTMHTLHPAARNNAGRLVYDREAQRGLKLD